MNPDIIDAIPQEIISAMWRFLGSSLLLVLIIYLSFRKKMNFEKTFILAAIRGLVQMLLLANILYFIFQLHGLLPLFAVLAVMITFGAQTIAGRIKEIDGIFRIELIALGISVFFVMGSMTLLRVLPSDNPAFWIPIGGMVTGNSMNISFLTLDRIKGEVANRKPQIEAALSLGAHPSYILEKLEITSTALRTGVTPSTNNLKTLGLVFIPGLMTGLLIGGVHPVAAALLQVMIFFLIISGGLIAGIIAVHLIEQKFFDRKTLALSLDIMKKLEMQEN